MSKDPKSLDAPRNLYGRRRSHKLRGGRQALMDAYLSSVSVPEADLRRNPDRRQIDLQALFGGQREIWLEIGFGGGEHLIHQALANPSVGLIGCEHYVDGVAKLLAAMKCEGVENVRVHPYDARDLMDVLPDGSVSKAFLLYPDPWPKTRHHKRRFISPENLDAFARILHPGAELRVASDIPDYIRHTLQLTRDRDDFEWMARTSADWREAWPDWSSTRYEAKAIREGRTPCYLTFRRV
ncbi:MAG: tRNA (guanosine(46)-N7)-methyltransferase TrmB [Pseudomonadota bacterium]